MVDIVLYLHNQYITFLHLFEIFTISTLVSVISFRILSVVFYSL